jgi:type III secretion system YscQ/HrcQ family protein
VVERDLLLGLGDGGFALAAAPGAVEGKVASGYVRRDMAALDDAQIELTVQLGTIRMPLGQIAELAVGQVIPLGRPLAGPFEVRAQGRLIGRGELIDVDGELGVRIVSVVEE